MSLRFPGAGPSRAMRHPVHGDRRAPPPACALGGGATGERLGAGVLWSAVGLIGYTYLVFPALTILRGLLRPKPHRRADITPTVTVIIAAHNEASVIRAKLDNLVGLDYPEDALEVIVVSDGSDDGTEGVVRGYGDPRIRLLPLARVGKAQALNAAAGAARSEILVFSDANGEYERGALRALVRPFADEGVGGVAGDQRYTADGAATVTGKGESLYWDLDRLLKAASSRSGNAISATGSIYAVRREFYDPIPEGVTDDFYVSTGVISRGRRLVFEPAARAYEPVAASVGAEYRRKVRVISQGFRSVLARRELLDVRRHGWYGIQLLSHKVLRRLVALPLLVIASSTPVLWRRRRGAYRLLGFGQLAFYGLAAIGALLPARGGRAVALAKLPAYFCMVNLAALQAVWNLIRGRRIARWDPDRD